VHGGFLEVLDNHVRVLSDVAEPGVEIDVARAQRALERASQELVNPSAGSDPATALAAVMRAEARLEAHRKAQANQE
jgi:F-type H+-transporting ATPase subunit epsilon